MSQVSYCVGIDVGKDSLEVASRPVMLHGPFPNTPQGHAELIRALQPHRVERIVLEATGGYEKALAGELVQAGFAAVVVNPRQVRDFAKGMGVRAKTDPIDAEVLALFAETVKPAVKGPEQAKQDDLAELVTRRRQLIDLRTQERNRLAMNPAATVRKSIGQIIKLLDKQIEQIDDLINQKIQSDDDLKGKDKIIRSVPGVGPQTSAMLLAHLPELGSLNRHQVAALVGVAPYDDTSGKRRGLSRISGGRANVRDALFMAAFNAVRANPAIRAFAEKLTAGGKCYKKVLTACMRKLIVILNALVRDHTCWSSDLCLKNT